MEPRIDQHEMKVSRRRQLWRLAGYLAEAEFDHSLRRPNRDGANDRRDEHPYARGLDDRVEARGEVRAANVLRSCGRTSRRGGQGTSAFGFTLRGRRPPPARRASPPLSQPRLGASTT